MRRRAVFIDRDGTLVEERHYLKDPAALRLYPHSLPALDLLRGTGLALVLVTNQSGVARGLMSEEDVAAVHARLAELLADGGHFLDAIHHCPHHPEGKVPAYARACRCRKPGTELLERAAAELGLELAGSWVVGDKPEDAALGAALGLRRVLVRTGHGAESERRLGDEGPEAVVDDLLAAARWIRDREEEA